MSAKAVLTRWLERQWYGGRDSAVVLQPLSGLFAAVARRRRQGYERNAERVTRLPCPVVIVGNISVGGTGKTPLVVALVKQLQEQGWQPGVISRGYGGKAASYPHIVNANSTAADCGDEPLLISQLCGVPVAVAPVRSEAGAALIEHCKVDVLIADDGLQHYALHRDIEIAVIDGARGIGNRRLLPAGPLREPEGRLKTVDWVISNGELLPAVQQTLAAINVSPLCMQLTQHSPVNEPLSLATKGDGWAGWRGKSVHAVAGIGNPERFFNQLQDQGLVVTPHAFADHHAYTLEELSFGDGVPVLMTGKDAVKCQAFWQPNFWQVPVKAELPARFWKQLFERLEAVKLTMPPASSENE